METMATAAGDSVDVILRDGGTLRLRPPTRVGREALLDFYRALSSQSLHRRFHGLPNLRPQLVESLLEPDWAERGALLGALADEGGERIVAIGNYVRLRDPALAESAFAVADTEQGRGIGTRLLERLAARAASVGIERFVAEVLCREQVDARRLRAGRLRADARARRRRRRGAVPDRARPSGSSSASRSATTPPSSRRCARSSSRRASPSSGHRRGAGRSAASSSATCSRGTSRAPRTRSTRRARRSPASAATPRWRRSRIPSTWR